MALRDDIRNAMIAAGFDPDDTTSATSPKYTARLFEAIAGVVKAGMAGSIDWSTLTEYDTAGTRKVTVPDGCDKMIVFGAAGGGGGGTSSGYESNNVPAGAGGGAGASTTNKIYSVKPGSNIAIIIGTGGETPSVGYSQNTFYNGGNGGATKIGSFLTLNGGYGGTYTIHDNMHLARGGASGGANAQSGQYAMVAGSNLIGLGSVCSIYQGVHQSGNPAPSAPSRGGGGVHHPWNSGSQSWRHNGAPGYACFAFIRKSS